MSKHFLIFAWWRDRVDGFGTTGCWLWKMALATTGYGITSRPSTGEYYAHRLSYRTFTGDIPAGLQIDHLCRNRACVNPLHLEAVTQQVNIARGISLSTINAKKTHCAKGHEFTAGNLYECSTRLGTRICRACKIEATTQRRRVAISANRCVRCRRVDAAGGLKSCAVCAEKDRAYHRRAQ